MVMVLSSVLFLWHGERLAEFNLLHQISFSWKKVGGVQKVHCDTSNEALRFVLIYHGKNTGFGHGLSCFSMQNLVKKRIYIVNEYSY